jgi:hydrogenase maturation protease
VDWGTSTRVLCLGNDLLADDAFGCLVARRLRQEMPGIDVVESQETGFRLLDHVAGASRLLVIDTVMSGAPPGTVRVLREPDFAGLRGGSPHYTGLFETLELGRCLKLPVPEEVLIIAVAASDCLTVGGALHPDLLAAIPRVLLLVAEFTASTKPTEP